MTAEFSETAKTKAMQQLPGLGRLAITSAQMVTAAGQDSAQILADVYAGFSHAKSQTGWFTVVNVEEPTEIMAANHPEIESTDQHCRLKELVLNWLESQATWPTFEPARIILLAPQDMTQWLASQLPFSNIDIEWHSDLTALLTTWNDDLLCALQNQAHQNRTAQQQTDEPAKPVLWLTLDSQIHIEPWYDQRANLYHSLNPEGRIVGEALTALWLNEAQQMHSTVYIGHEPKAQQAALDTTTELNELFKQAPTAALNRLLTSHSQSTLHACEMYHFISQATQRVIAEEPDDPEYYCIPPEIEPPIKNEPQSMYACFGDVGLCTLPLQLALIHHSNTLVHLNTPWQSAMVFHQQQRIYWPFPKNERQPPASLQTDNRHKEASA